QLAYEKITQAPDIDLVLQSRRTAGMISAEHGMLFPGLLITSLIVGSLSAGAIKPHIQRLAALRNRISHLCNDAHLALVYQPIFDLQTLRPVGCEVLARMREGEQTWMPDLIIPALQE